MPDSPPAQQQRIIQSKMSIALNSEKLCFKPCMTIWKYFLFYFLQRGREWDRELETSMRENHRSAASCTPYWGYARNQGTCPCPESNPGPFCPQANALSTEPNWSRQVTFIKTFLTYHYIAWAVKFFVVGREFDMLVLGCHKRRGGCLLRRDF